MCRFQHVNPSTPIPASSTRNVSDSNSALSSTTAKNGSARNHKKGPKKGKIKENSSVSITAAVQETQEETDLMKASSSSSENTKKKFVLIKKKDVDREQQHQVPDLSKLSLTEAPADPVIKPVQKPRPKVSMKPNSKVLQDMLDNCSTFEERATVLQNYQITVLKRRYPQCHVVKSESKSSVVDLTLIPSDPDFPFDLPGGLSISIHFNRFPSYRDCTITINNLEIPFHLRANISKAFSKKCNDTQWEMLQLMNWLDKELENLLVEKEQEGGMVVLNSENIFIGEKPKSGKDAEDSADVDEVEENIKSVDESSVEEELREDSDSEEQEALIDTTKIIQKGTSIRLLNLSMDNISLIQILVLSLVIKCNRCKTLADARNMQPNPQGEKDWLSIECAKCHEVMAINFRPDTLHQLNGMGQVGFVDCVGCSAFDLLPSKYQATCSNCGEIQPKNGCFETYNSSKLCFSCHVEMKFQASQPKFVTLGSNTNNTSLAIQAKINVEKMEKKKQKREGLSVGTPLPSNGTCSHYKRSFRWFRFPCCNKLFPCDDCHEEQNPDGHEMQWATRMVCGYCSREQVYTSSGKSCICGRDLVRSETSGFWNGGLGTRDKNKMNRNESKKYQGIGKTISRKKASNL